MEKGGDRIGRSPHGIFGDRLIKASLMIGLLAQAAYGGLGLLDPEESIRIEAARSLRAADDPSRLSDLLVALDNESSSAVRAELARTLASGRYRGERAYQALAKSLFNDASDAVRTAAAESVASYEGPQPVALLEQALRSEQGAGVRAAVCIALSTGAAHVDDALASALLSSLLGEDPSPEVRLAAVAAFVARDDLRGLAALQRAAAKDPAQRVRVAAKKALRTVKLAEAPAPRKRAVGGYDAVKGKDKCSGSNGWCECGRGEIYVRPRCVEKDECAHTYRNNFRHQGFTCTWNSLSLE